MTMRWMMPNTLLLIVLTQDLSYHTAAQCLIIISLGPWMVLLQWFGLFQSCKLQFLPNREQNCYFFESEFNFKYNLYQSKMKYIRNVLRKVSCKCKCVMRCLIFNANRECYMFLLCSLFIDVKIFDESVR